MSDLTPDHLVEMQIADIRLAAAKMSGLQRRCERFYRRNVFKILQW